MLGLFQKSKEEQRFYLLPGMGGRAYRRKQKVFLTWAIIIGVLVSALFAGALYYMATQR